MTDIEPARVQVGEYSIAYRRAGSGPALVLLHGFLCDSRCWITQLRELSDQFDVIACDAPGAGMSSDPPAAFSLADWAHVLGRFLDALGVGRAIVLGLSWGGLLAQEFYRLYPSLVHGLILADTYAGWKGSLGEPVAEQRLARCLRESDLPKEEFVAEWVPVEFFSEAAAPELASEMAAVVSGFHPHGFRLMAKTLAESDTTDLITQIHVPTLLLWGDADRRSPLAVAEQFYDKIPNAKLGVISHAGHVSNMEKPAEFNAEVRRFCAAVYSATQHQPMSRVHN